VKYPVSVILTIFHEIHRWSFDGYYSAYMRYKVSIVQKSLCFSVIICTLTDAKSCYRNLLFNEKVSHLFLAATYCTASLICIWYQYSHDSTWPIAQQIRYSYSCLMVLAKPDSYALDAQYCGNWHTLYTTFASTYFMILISMSFKHLYLLILNIHNHSDFC